MSARRPGLPGAPGMPSSTALRVAAGAAVVAGLFAIAYVMDLGPFEERQLTRGQLIARADQVCDTARDAFSDLQAQPVQTAEQSAELTGQLVDIARGESAQLAALDGPADVEAQIDAYLAERARGIEQLERGRAAAEAEDARGYERAQAQLAASQLRRERLAREIGFGACSRPLVDRRELARQAEPPTAPAG